MNYLITSMVLAIAAGPAAAAGFEGKYFSGQGDPEYIELLDISRRLFEPDPEFQNMPMLYTPAWNGFVEGPTWGAWWIQNSYGPTYCSLPFWIEPYTTFIGNSHDLWFDQMGDGQRKGKHDWVAPDGQLCDAAAPGLIYYKQGDGRIDIHDWGMEFTAAGVIMQAELLLISRDLEAIEKYLPKLERSANFIETRRDPKNNLFLAGPAGNLLAPSYAGWKKPDGTFDKAYLAGLSISYIAALDRLIELEKMAERDEQVKLYTERRELARQGLPALVTDEGYFIKYMDPDGTKHGVYGAARHGYFETVCNHDAICFRVADDAQSEKIYQKIASIPGLRPYDLIITNHPELDDMYQESTSIWKFGHWVNGGHWSTCEARMIMAYYRLGKYEDARRSMKKMLDYARRFRMDNPLIDFGNDVYQPNVPINCVYDNWGVPAAMIRGLYEYLYTAGGLKIVPHIPAGITELHQRFPIRFGEKRLYLSIRGSGPIVSVEVDGKAIKSFEATTISLGESDLSDRSHVAITRESATGNWNTEWNWDWVKPAPVAPVDFAAVKELGNTNSLPVRLGADSAGGDQFVGQFRRARIFSIALSDDQIGELAESGDATAKTRMLVADWQAGKLANGIIQNRAGSDLHAKATGELKTVAGAVEFTGRGWLEVADDPRLILANGFTLDAWIRPDRFPPGGMRIIDKCHVGTSDGYTFDTYPGNALRLITPVGAVSFDAKLEPEKWVHVAAVHDPKGELRLYIDGKKVASAPVQPRPKAHLERIQVLYERLQKVGMEESYEGRHARLILDYAATVLKRRAMQKAGELKPLADAGSQSAADASYTETVLKLSNGFETVLDGYGKSPDKHKKKVYKLWRATE